MSAYVLSQKHINVLVTYANRNELLYRNWPDVDEAADALMAQNVASVNYRYRDHTPETPAQGFFRWDTSPRSAVEIIKACDCYDYQSCETPNYDETLAAKLITRIRAHAISHLPGYDAADWSIE